MAQTGLAPRRAAWHLLQEIIGEGRLLSELLGAGALDHLTPADRARAQRLTVSALRGLDRADRMLKPYLTKRPSLAVMNALRLGVIELCGGEAAHGVVNSYVEVVARNKHAAKMKGLTNAVLRRIADEGQAGWDKRPVPILPKWLRQPLVEAWGRKPVHGIEMAHFAGAPLDLSVKGDPLVVADSLGGAVLPNGSVRVREAGQVSALAGFEDGAWWVQDAAAAMPVQLLGDVTGLKVLDLCAAPGGKTMQLAAGGAAVTAVDLSESRMARVAENLGRVGLQARTIVSDAFAFDQGGFDVVLLDAPCSATGTIRRHPDLPYAKDGSEFGMLIEQQGRLIDHAMSLTKPGGRLLYCTCSLLPDEGEVQVEEALVRHPGVTMDRAALDQSWVDPAWVTEEGGMRLRPDFWADHGGMDGFYMGVMMVPESG